tara:strand:+ start:30716 stop:31201 length:486 start_codon:yes stop_codon:yes gene_type:complete
MTSKNILIDFLFITFSILFLSACNNNNSNPFVADYSDAPPLPDTSSAISKVTFESGLIYYLIEEGNPESFDVVFRDDIIAYYTTRLEDEEIIGSSYINGSTSPVRVNNVGDQSTINYVGSGFAEGVIGMKEGERRVLVIPSEINSTSETLIFDIDLVTIEY